MRNNKLTFIHRDIHDFRTPIVVPPDYIKQLRKIGEITPEEKRQALRGEAIQVLGYRVVANKKLQTKLRNNGRNNNSF